jgi:uncharacterized protein
MITFPQDVWKGIEQFNRQQFFEAHESLETAWRAEPGAIRGVYQGILQVGVAFFHLEHHNLIGAQKSLEFARRNLYPWIDQPLPIDLPDLIAQMDLAEAAIQRSTAQEQQSIHIACPCVRPSRPE